MDRYRGPDSDLESGQLRGPSSHERYESYVSEYDDIRERDRRKDRDLRDMYRDSNERERARDRDAEWERDREREAINRGRERDWPRSRDFEMISRPHDSGGYGADSASIDRPLGRRPSSPSGFVGQNFTSAGPTPFSRSRYDAYPPGRTLVGEYGDDRDRLGSRPRYESYVPGRTTERIGRGPHVSVYFS
jgi:hypothetical protein